MATRNEGNSRRITNSILYPRHGDQDSHDTDGTDKKRNEYKLLKGMKETFPLGIEKVKKYRRSKPLDSFRALHDKKRRHELQLSAKVIQKTSRFTARTEVLLPEESGFIEADPFANESTHQVSQEEIIDSVDITTATKHFNLDLQYGPYKVDYFRSGRYLVLAGARGHVAALDWITKDLLCEFNVQESAHAAKWLHVPTMFAVAQKDWVHIYDAKGTELHCLKKLYRVQSLEFLPYHFLLVSASDNGFLTWTDTSVGRIVSTTKSRKCPRISEMCQNPNNAIIHTGHPNGVVNFWSPNSPDPLVSMLCAGCPIRGISIDSQGRYMASLAVNGELKIWDVRQTYKSLHEYQMRNSPSGLCFSQKDLLAVTTGNIVQIFKDLTIGGGNQNRPTPYLRHKVDGIISNAQFVNFEDVLGVGHANGFTSCIIPGASEPNFDSFEANPYMTKSQRREVEVKQLLEKVQPELISLDPRSLAIVNRTELVKIIKEKEKLPHVVTPRVELTVSNKKTKSGLRAMKKKEKRHDQALKEGIRQKNNQIKSQSYAKSVPPNEVKEEDPAMKAGRDALERFKKKSLAKRFTKK